MNASGCLELFYAKLNNGRFIRSVVATVLRVSAVLTALAGAVVAFMLLGDAFRATEAGPVIGFIMATLFWLAWVVCQIGVFLYRANTILRLPDSNYTVLPIISIYFRVYGESSLVAFTLLGVGGCLFLWCANFNPLWELGGFGALMPHAASGIGFLGGLWFLLFMLSLAFGFTLLFYFLAELTIVLPEIANNTRGLQLGPNGGSQPRIPEPVVPVGPARSFSPAPPHFVPPPPVVEVCQRCSAPLDPESEFCGDCGARRPA